MRDMTNEKNENESGECPQDGGQTEHLREFAEAQSQPRSLPSLGQWTTSKSTNVLAHLPPSFFLSFLF